MLTNRMNAVFYYGINFQNKDLHKIMMQQDVN